MTRVWRVGREKVKMLCLLFFVQLPAIALCWDLHETTKQFLSQKLVLLFFTLLADFLYLHLVRMESAVLQQALALQIHTYQYVGHDT